MEYKTAQRIAKVWLTFAVLLILAFIAGCCSAKPTPFIATDPLGDNVEYVAHVVVNKEGYHFLWCIPFACATEGVARETMEQEVKAKYPNADGVFEYKVLQERGVSLFDWKPTLTITGKVGRIRK